MVKALCSPWWGRNSSEFVLHAFTGGADGALLLGPLTFDASGNIYGTADGGSGYGLVFKLTLNKFKAGWTETVLYAFAYQDRIQPNGGVIFDAAGNLYGATAYGGARTWARCTSLRTTQTAAGAQACCTRSPAPPMAKLLIPRSSSTTPVIFMAPPWRGPLFDGTVFKLTPGSGDQWTETILYGFSGGADGGQPLFGVILDSAGNLYGTTRLVAWFPAVMAVWYSRSHRSAGISFLASLQQFKPLDKRSDTSHPSTNPTRAGMRSEALCSL